jgi:predicted AlkP superfamily phosphohydrolase/phosphomutase
MNKVAMIGLDACDIELVYQWSETGHLPNFKKLIDKSATLELASSCSVLQGSIWPSLFTASSPGDHAMYYMLQMDNTTQNVKRVKSHDLKTATFWHTLPNDKKRLIVDVPKLGLVEQDEHVQVVEWAAMDHYSRFETQPKHIKNDIIKKFGNHVLTTDLVEPKSNEEFKRLFQDLSTGIQNKAQLNRDLINTYQPDFFLTVFGESHTAGHYLWRFHQEALAGKLTQFTTDPVLNIYQELDIAVGDILNDLPENQNVMVFSGHGMMEDQYPRWILNDVLERLGVLKSFHSSQSDQHQTAHTKQKVSFSSKVKKWIKGIANDFIIPASIQEKLWMKNLQKHVDFTQTKAWVLPTDLQGFIRINLEGREPQGIVAKADYDQLVEQITECLYGLKNSETGQPVVDKVYKIKELYKGCKQTDLLPDISVLWANKPVKKVSSDIIGEIELSDTGIIRSGNHRPKGFCFAYGPNIDSSHKDIQANLTDLGPMAMHMLQHYRLPLNPNTKAILRD